MSFTSSLFIYGSLLALIPIIIHLIYRRQSRIVQFPSLMFFRLISKRIARKQNIREWIILILRFLTIFLISFALANPILSAFNLNSGSTCAVVLIIDDSYSMSYVKNSETLFEKAKQQALEILSTLQPGDKGQIILTSKLNNDKEASLTLDIDSLRLKILQSEVSNNANSLKNAFVTSVELLNNSQMPNKECYVISDFREPAIRDNLQEIVNDDVRVFSIPIICETFESIAISDIEILNPNLVHNSKSRLKVTVNNFLGFEKKVQVSLFIQQFSDDMKSAKYIDNEEIQEIVFTSNEYEKSTYFEVFSTDSIVLSGYVELKSFTNDEKDFVVDNKRYFSVNIGTKKNVLVINGEPNDINFDDEVFFIKAALNAQNIYDFTENNELDFDNLDQYHAIFLCNRSVFNSDTESYQKLKSYIENGGILVVFPGDNNISSEFNSFYERNNPEDSIMPASLDKIVFNGHDNTKQSLKPFSDYNLRHYDFSELDTSQVVIETYWKLSSSVSDTDTDIIAHFTNDDICLCAKKTGAGNVFLFAIPADREWTNFPPRKLFPILIHQILEKRNSSNDNIHPGETFKTSILNKLGKTQIQVLTPAHINDSENEIILRPNYFSSFGGENNTLKFPYDLPTNNINSTFKPGVYLYKINPSDPASNYHAFCVNPDTAEANPKTSTFSEIKNAIPNSVILMTDSNIADSIRTRREGTSIWLIFAFCCLIAFVFESLLANQKLPTNYDEKMQN